MNKFIGKMFFPVFSFLLGVISMLSIVFWIQHINTVDLVNLLEKQCDQEKILDLREYDCPAKITPVLHYKDGSLDNITWEKKNGVSK